MFLFTLSLAFVAASLNVGWFGNLKNPCSRMRASYRSSASPDCVLLDASGKFLPFNLWRTPF